MAEGFSIAEGFVNILSRIDRSANRRNAERAGDEAGESFATRMGTKLVSGITNSVLPAIGAVLNLGLAAAPALGAAAVAIWQVAQGALAAAPALLALGAAGALVKLTLTAIMPAIQKSLSPIKDAFDKATESASKLATVGVKPLAREFVKLNMPQVSDMMDRIAVSTNKVVTRFLAWTSTAEGIGSIRNITQGTADLFEKISPLIGAVATSFVAMLGRIMKVSAAAGGAGLSGVLMHVKNWLDGITAESVQGGLDKLRSTFISIKDAVSTVAQWIGTAVRLYRQYKTEIMLISDALGILAIVFGGPVTAIIALIGLVIRHFDTFKAAYQGLVNSFKSSTEGPRFLNNLKAAADVVVPALVNGFKLIWAAIGPTLSKIFNQIKTQLIPALGDFIAAAAPLVKFFVERLAPMVANAMNTVLKVISGVITIITGIFKVFTGILRGNWSQVWAGIVQILRGAVQILGALVRGLVVLIRQGLSNLGVILAGIFSRAVNSAVSAFRAIVGRIRAVAGQVKGAITGALSGAGGWLIHAGGQIIGGLIQGIRNKIGELKGTLGSVTNLIPSWKGPETRDAKLLTPAGASIMAGLMAGIRSQLPALRDQLGGITAAIPDLTGSPGARGAITGQPVAGPGGGGITIGQLIINLKGILDPTDPASKRRMAKELFEMISAYEKSYA